MVLTLSALLASVYGDVGGARLERQPGSIEQVHVAVGHQPGDIVITFVTVSTASGPTPVMRYGVDAADPVWQFVDAAPKQYTWAASWTGTVYSVRLYGLLPGTYAYQCSLDNSTFSASRVFDVLEWALPVDGSWTFGFTADMGTYPASRAVAASMEPLTDVEMWLLGGDLSYSAGWDGQAPNQATNDAFWNMIERYAASIPTMCSAGNHEWYDNRFGAYKGRCGAQMPVMDPNLVYYSFDYRNVHFISVDSVTMEAGDPNQISWLTSDLQAAVTRRQAGIIQWIVVFFHYALYSSVDPTRGHGSDYTLRNIIEPVLQPYSVDLILTGHDHLYERTNPVYNGSPLSTSNPVYAQGIAPIHVCAGTGGASYYAGWSQPQPSWSVSRLLFHGYVLIEVMGNGTLYFSAWNESKVLQDEFWLTATPATTTPAPTTTQPSTTAPLPASTAPPATTAPPTVPPETSTFPPTSPAATYTSTPTPSPTVLTPPPLRVERTTIVLLAVLGGLFVIVVAIILPGMLCYKVWGASPSRPVASMDDQELQIVSAPAEGDD